ncbi:MAG: hypothetical protein A2161_08770 [Candidatus Schekmanbacteria bacterium RBG_13_48_7]|uniref:Uncharacterized protein n=1 Tax=Candidatus Schekmanbacteria bacterium RBG_13_48_7 TaxID=1817878 RepID=A0A1F7S6Z8_9BACT|nr:MAG: hypothetical protein A2161_08770 [Candidatus Schekmanbacteria bacterium RBG_13_48_7]
MKKLLLLAIGLFCVCLVSQSVFAQCNPRSSMIPFVRVQGNLLCSGLGAPTAVVLQQFNVDGVLCAAENYDWTYPRTVAGTYQLNFWLDNTIDHNLSICVQATCDDGTGGTVNETGGFSTDGTTAGACSDTALFGQSQAAVQIHIVTPVQLSTFSSTAN